MGVFKLFGAEMQKLQKNKKVLMAIVGVCLVPIIYAAILLSPTWGPYDNLDNLPVAFVNKDAGAVSNGEPINVGEDLLATLKESNTLGWNFVTEKEAQEGLEEQKFYMVIEVPEDFSQKVTTVLDENPQVPELIYIQNEGLSFMGAQVTNSASERLREQLGDKITATYAKTVFSKFGAIEDGFTAGADGASQIADGSTQLAEGAQQMYNSLTEKQPDIKKLAEGAAAADAGAGQLLSAVQGGASDIQRLANGSKQLATGVTSLKDGSNAVLNGLTQVGGGSKQVLGGLNQVSDGSKQVLGGLTQVNNGSKQVLTGLTSAQTGANTVLGGLNSAQTGASQLATGIEQTVLPGVQQLATGVTAATTGIGQLTPAAQGVAQGLKALAEQMPQMAQSPQFQQLLQYAQAVSEGLTTLNGQAPALQAGARNLAGGIEQQILPGAQGLNSGLQQLVAGQTQLTGGLDQLVAGQTSAVAGINQLIAGQTSAVAGVEQLVAGQKTAVAGVNQLQSGAQQVAAGNAKVATSWTTLQNGVASLKEGTAQISEGNKTVETGWSTLSEGASALNEGATKLKAGGSELATGLEGGAGEVAAVKVTDANIAMFASPVLLKGEKVNKYEFYRDSTAPYILSLALFVGMLILSLFVDFKKPAAYPSSPTSWFVAKWLKLAMFATIQALLISIFTVIILGLTVTNIPLFILFSVLVSITFMSIIFFLVSVGGHIGRFIGVVFIVAQLSITGSNLPIPMLPEGLRSLSTLLPLTYSNAGFKSIISLGDTGMTMTNGSILAMILVGCSLLTLVAFFVTFKMVVPSKDEEEIVVS